MRKSTVLFVLVSIVCASTAGCAPTSDPGAVALFPRAYPFVPNVTSTPPTTLPEEPAVASVQR